MKLVKKEKFIIKIAQKIINLKVIVYNRLILPLRKELGLHKYFLFYYVIFLNSDNKEGLFNAYGDIVLRYYQYPNKNDVIQTIKGCWEYKGYNINSIFITSIEKLSRVDSLLWTVGLQNDVPDVSTYDFLKKTEEDIKIN